MSCYGERWSCHVVGRGGHVMWWGEVVMSCGGERWTCYVVGRGGHVVWWGAVDMSCGGEQWSCGGRAVERRAINRGDGGSIPSTSISKLRQFYSPHICLCQKRH